MRDHERIEALREAVGLVLLFHGGETWTEVKASEWQRVTGSTEATTKVMCDHLRKILSFTKEPDGDETSVATLRTALTSVCAAADAYLTSYTALQRGKMASRSRLAGECFDALQNLLKAMEQARAT